MPSWKIHTTTLNNIKIKKAFIYIILWSAGFIVAVTILFLWNKGEKFESVTIFNNLEELPTGRGGANNIVDELLLSANEFNIYGKSSLIEYNYKGDNRANELIQQIKADPDNTYQTILKNKLQILKQPKNSTFDFNVKPVPK